jgi:hypothetical protein
MTGAALPLRVAWPAAVPTGSPIYRYTLERSLDGGPWTALSLSSRLARSRTIKLRSWQVMSFRVRAEDREGNLSEWAESAPMWLSSTQENDVALELDGQWQTVQHAKAFGGQRATSTTAGDTASFSFSGSDVAWVAQLGPNRGEADVYIDGVYFDTLDLRRSRTTRRRLVFTARWADPGEHTIEIVNRGTFGRPTIDVDAFAVIGPAGHETLVGAGDISRCTNDGDSQTAAVIAGVQGVVYTTGDNVYGAGTAEEFATCYHPTWGAFKDRTRPVPGNHDYDTPGATGYYDYFGEAAAEPAKGWYAYEAGTWRVYALNSECEPWRECSLEQKAWLSADLAANPHRCVLAYWHRPTRSSGPHGGSSRMTGAFEVLYNAGAEVVLTGHDHTYERFAPAKPDGTRDADRGLRQFVVGTGGAALYAFVRTLALTEARDNSTHGVLRLDLRPGEYSWSFLPAGSGTFTDSGSEACH